MCVYKCERSVAAFCVFHSGWVIINEWLCLNNNYSNKLTNTMELNLEINAAHASLCDPPSKITSSQGTDASDRLVFGKKISVISCASSLSLQQNAHLETANELFACYLFAHDEATTKMHYHRMKIHLRELQETQPERIQSLSLFKLGSFEEDSIVLSHFIGSWLLFMGYATSKHRKYFVSRIRVMAGEGRVGALAKIYNNLSLLGLQDKKLLQLLLETCKNGWQYFTREVVRLESSLRSKIGFDCQQ